MYYEKGICVLFFFYEIYVKDYVGYLNENVVV